MVDEVERVSIVREEPSDVGAETRLSDKPTLGGAPRDLPILSLGYFRLYGGNMTTRISGKMKLLILRQRWG